MRYELLGLLREGYGQRWRDTSYIIYGSVFVSVCGMRVAGMRVAGSVESVQKVLLGIRTTRNIYDKYILSLHATRVQD
jgi:hypothetical protein